MAGIYTNTILANVANIIPPNALTQLIHRKQPYKPFVGQFFQGGSSLNQPINKGF